MLSVASFKTKHKLWFYAFLASNLLLVFFGLIANPYRLLPISLTIPRINDIKPRLYDYQRYVKIFDIAHQKPKTVLLGSSRILWGIDPKSPALQQANYLPVYNAGVLGPPMYEIRKYFDHALASQPDLKRVILGVDFYAFNQKFDGRNFPHEESFGKHNKALLKLNKKLLWDVKAIFETLRTSLLHSETKTLAIDGRLTPAPYERKDLYQDFYSPAKSTLGQAPQVKKEEPVAVNQPANVPKEDLKTKVKKMANVLYGDFKLSKDDIDSFRHIVETCKERNIELFVFFTPPFNGMDQGEIFTLHLLDIWKDYKTLMRTLVGMHPFWSFVHKSKITINRDNYVDGSHFIFPVGDMIINTMMKKSDENIPKDFGRYITTANVNQYLNLLESEYQKSVKKVKM